MASEDNEKMIKDMHRALVGDPFDQENHPGLVKTVGALRDDINGTKLQPMGIRQKVEKMWETHGKVTTITVFLIGGCGFAAWLIPMIIHKIL